MFSYVFSRCRLTLATDKVRYVDDAVAMVVTENRYAERMQSI